MLMSPKMGGDTSLPPSTFLTLALPFFSDIRMLQNDPTLGPEIDAKQKKDGLTGTPLLIQVYEL